MSKVQPSLFKIWLPYTFVVDLFNLGNLVKELDR